MIEIMNKDNLVHCSNMAIKLWPDMDEDEYIADLNETLLSNEEIAYLFRQNDGRYIGFVQLSIRKDYVEGSSSSPVAYVEGIYVEEEARKLGVARKLIEAAESWGKSMGCTELASDCELTNLLSVDFHKSVGFEETNRLVCFIKGI